MEVGFLASKFKVLIEGTESVAVIRRVFLKCCLPLALKLFACIKRLEGLLKDRLQVPGPNLKGSRIGPRICISNMFPGDANAGLATTF